MSKLHPAEDELGGHFDVDTAMAAMISDGYTLYDHGTFIESERTPNPKSQQWAIGDFILSYVHASCSVMLHLEEANIVQVGTISARIARAWPDSNIVQACVDWCQPQAGM